MNGPGPKTAMEPYGNLVSGRIGVSAPRIAQQLGVPVPLVKNLAKPIGRMKMRYRSEFDVYDPALAATLAHHPDVLRAREAAVLHGEARREGAAKAVETKRARILAYVDGLTIEVPDKYSREQLIQAACDSYNDNNSGKPDRLWASPSDSEDFLLRITVNYLRHVLTRYESELAEIAGKTGVDEAYLALRQKVLDAIADAYPWLEEECWRQERW